MPLGEGIYDVRDNPDRPPPRDLTAEERTQLLDYLAVLELLWVKAAFLQEKLPGRWRSIMSNQASALRGFHTAVERGTELER